MMPQNIYYIPIGVAITLMGHIVQPLERRWLFGLDWDKSPNWVAEQLADRCDAAGAVPYREAISILYSVGGNRGLNRIRDAWRTLKFLPEQNLDMIQI